MSVPRSIQQAQHSDRYVDGGMLRDHSCYCRDFPSELASRKFGLEFLQTISFILVIAALVQMVEIVLKKISPALYASLGIFLPLITTNCAVLGVALTVVQKSSPFAAAADGMMNLGEATVYAFATSLGFGLAMVLFAGLREQLALNNVPKAFRGVPIALITASLLAMAFMGFSGLV